MCYYPGAGLGAGGIRGRDGLPTYIHICIIYVNLARHRIVFSIAIMLKLTTSLPIPSCAGPGMSAGGLRGRDGRIYTYIRLYNIYLSK